MTNVIKAFPGGLVTPSQQEAMNELDRVIAKGIDAAKAAGVPQGLIVALMHGHALAQTQSMIE